jgi:hypothetical protein
MTVDFSMIAGTNREIKITVKDATFTAVDISDADIVWVAVLTMQGEPEITKSTNGVGEITITDGPLGQFSVFLKPVNTEDKGGVTLLHEARTIKDGIEEVVYQGSFAVTPSASYGKMPI